MLSAKITSNRRIKGIDVSRMRRDINKLMREALISGVRAWLNSMLTRGNRGGKFPVLTGMAAGALIPVGRVVRRAIPISPVGKKAGRTPASGAAMSHAEITGSGGKFTFEWETFVKHFELNEKFQIGTVLGTPWEFVPPSNREFSKRVRSFLKQRGIRFSDYFR